MTSDMQRRRPWQVASDVCRELKVEHTLFGLPFAYAGALLAARGVPSGHQILWITLAVVGARTAAMAANRLFDAPLDARNPRTQDRLVASGRLAPSVMAWTIAAGLGLLIVAAWQLNWLCLALAPIGAAALLLYPLAKRWTWGSHFLLGAVDGLAPLGAWIAVRGKVEAGGLLLFAAVTLWVAGFDVLYALMDRAFDRSAGLHSVPAQFGVSAAEHLGQALHVGFVAALVWAGLASGVRAPYWAGIGVAVALVAYESLLIARQHNVFALNRAVFNANMAFSVLFFATTAASVVVQP